MQGCSLYVEGSGQICLTICKTAAAAKGLAVQQQTNGKWALFLIVVLIIVPQSK